MNQAQLPPVIVQFNAVDVKGNKRDLNKYAVHRRRQKSYEFSPREGESEGKEKKKKKRHHSLTKFSAHTALATRLSKPKRSGSGLVDRVIFLVSRAAKALKKPQKSNCIAITTIDGTKAEMT